MKQVLIIHGGDSFSSYESYVSSLRASKIDYERLKLQHKWRTWIAEQLQEADVLLPTFPNSNNAVYDEWKIYFEKLTTFFGDDVHLVGHSLGAMFLARYLQDSPFERKVSQVILIAGGYDDDSNEDLGSFRVQSATNLPQSSDDIHLLHSIDDPVVPYTELAKFQADLPSATTHVFDGRGHFIDATFPELLDILNQK